MNSFTRNLLFWSPRVLTIIFALFLGLFALDVFDGSGFWPTVLALFIHLLPTVLILAFLIISWRWEWIGAIVYVALGILYIVMAYGQFPFSVFVTISGPLFLVGILFLINWIYRDELC